MKRFLRTMLSIMLCLTLVSVAKMSVSAASTDKEFWRVKVGSVELSDDQCITANDATTATAGDNNGNYVAYFKDGTLFLNNLSINGQIKWYARDTQNSPLEFDLTLDLTGNNTVNNSSGTAIEGNTGWVTGRGMSLIITGSGSLNVTGREGMWVWKNVTVKGNATVTVTGTNRFAIGNNSNIGVITVSENATVTATGNTYGIAYDNYYSGSAVKVTGGSLTAIGNTAAFRQSSITMETGVSAQASTAVDGSNAANYDSANHANYKWYQSTYTALPTYTVSFGANGGSGTMADVTGVSGDYTLPSCGFTAPDGQQFKAWSVGGAEKAVGDKINVTTNTTVTAVWEDIPVAALTGTVTLTGDAKFGSVLTATVTNSNNTGTLSYTWYRGGMVLTGATGPTYTLVQNDLNSKIKVEVTSSVQTGSIVSAQTDFVGKADGPAAPTGLGGVAPTTAGGTDGKITGTTSAMEYTDVSSFSYATRCDDSETRSWGVGTFYVRYRETDSHKAGEYATVVVPDFGSGGGPGTPAAYTVSFGANGGSGTMTDVTGVSGDYTLPSCGFTAPNGKQFKAWSVDGAEKAVGDKITVTADTTITAVWINIPTNVTEHKWSSWMTDETNHWVECIDDSCDMKNYSLGAHADGNADGKCDICQYAIAAGTAQAPKTGEDNRMLLWSALLLAGSIGATATVIGKKRFSVK